MMVIRLIVKLLGGFWGVRNKYHSTRVNLYRKIIGILYIYSLKSKGSWISLDAQINGEPCFPHGISGIFISSGAKIGKNCVIFQQVTIGSNSLIDSNYIGAPQLGDNCYVGAGAKIIGNIKIENNVRIGANAVVVKNVSENCLVISGLQRVLKKSKPLDNSFYHMHKKKWTVFKEGKWKNVTDLEKIKKLEIYFHSH